MKQGKSIPGEKLTVYLGEMAGLMRAAGEMAAEVRAPHDPIDPSTFAESRDVNAKWVVIVGSGLLLLLWAIVVSISLFFVYLKYDRTGGRSPSAVLSYIPPQPPLPRNESNSIEEMNAFRAREEYILTHYSWIDKKAGVVSIPIDRAIALLAQRGIPRGSTHSGEYVHPHAGSMRTGARGSP
ncbi:MAG TPA: hypothetical protein VKX39_10765 [Bryobacteraceae bacterium]|jgi:hypothetical protein|nr:hypothetical protein [Bryobacteraceae bacterium]